MKLFALLLSMTLATAELLITEEPNTLVEDLGKKKKKNNSDGGMKFFRKVKIHLKSPLDPDEMTLDMQAYFEDAVVASYNAVHPGDDVQSDYAQLVMKGLEDDDEDGDSTNLRRGRSRPYGYIFRSWYFGYGGYYCRACPPDDDSAYLMTPAHRAAWGRQLCKMLDSSPFEELQKAEDCWIEVQGESLTEEA